MQIYISESDIKDVLEDNMTNIRNKILIKYTNNEYYKRTCRDCGESAEKKRVIELITQTDDKEYDYSFSKKTKNVITDFYCKKCFNENKKQSKKYQKEIHDKIESGELDLFEK